MSLNQESNPLLQIQFRIPFDRIRAEHVEPAVEELLPRRGRSWRRLRPTRPAHLRKHHAGLEALTEPLDYAMGMVRHLESVATYPELRAAQRRAAGGERVLVEHPLHEGLWNNLQRMRDRRSAQLTGARRRFLNKTMDDFRRHGAELDPAGKRGWKRSTSS